MRVDECGSWGVKSRAEDSYQNRVATGCVVSDLSMIAAEK